MQSMTRKILAAALVVGMGGMTACESSVGLGADANADVAFKVSENNSLLGLNSSQPNEMSSGDDTIVLTAATLTVSELELKGFNVDSGGRSKFESGPITIDLPIEGGLSRSINAVIAPGTYDKFEMHVRFLRLQGTYNSTPFDVTLKLNNETEMRLSPPLVVTDGTTSTAITVDLDIQNWFRSSTGGLINPQDAATDPTLLAQLRYNIRSSFRAFDDHGRHGGRGGDDSDDDDDDDDNSGSNG